ncbi:MAG TPA: serine/threonine-protein kinase, partial [Pyrinomonadaceae bacterium]
MRELPANTTLSHYRIVARIGAGAMGEVYLAQDTKLDRQVALKILPEEFAADADRMRRFVQEAKAASALNHPNIITIHEIGEADGVPYIATEFVDGVTLHDQMANPSFTLSRKLAVATQIAEALQVAHRAGIVHRDIKPGNVMLRGDGYVKLLDFGIAKLTEQNSAPTDSEADTKERSLETKAGTILGTTHYMSPEQIRSRPIDGRTDIWSLGVLLYEMVAGQKPFQGETFGDQIAAILQNEPAALSELAPQCPPELERIIGKALQKSRKQRYQQIKDFANELKILRRQLAFASELERSGTPDRTNAPTASITAQTGTATQHTSSAEY